MDTAQKQQLTGVGATGLLFLVLLLSVFDAGVVVATCFFGLALIFGMTGWLGFAMTLVAGIIAMGIPGVDSLWYLERSWSVLLFGCFATITMFFPNCILLERAIGTLCMSLAIVSVFFLLDYESWYRVDEMINQGIISNINRSLDVFRQMDSIMIIQRDLSATALQLAGYQSRLFPALLGLSSLASMAVAWWGYIGLSGKKLKSLMGLSEFKFNDHLVWCLIGGLLFLVSDVGEGWSRVGENLVFFMVSLYVLRGTAVFLVTTGILFFGKVSLFLGLIFLAPVVLTIAFLIGLSDTWFDYRNRVRILS